MSFRKNSNRRDRWQISVQCVSPSLLDLGLPRDVVSNEDAFRSYLSTGEVADIKMRDLSVEQFQSLADSVRQLFPDGWDMSSHVAFQKLKIERLGEYG